MLNLQIICLFLLSATVMALCAFVVVELHYFGRLLLCFILAKFLKKKKHIMDEMAVTGVCLFNDVDYLLTHMNNARYLRELDFAKADFYERTQLYKKIISQGGKIFAGATTIRYRRFIKVFSKYQIKTKIIYWDNQNIYMEHKFISNNFINAIAFCRLRLVKVDVEELMKDLIYNHQKNVADIEASRKQKPEMPLELEKWIESNKISSKNLREAAITLENIAIDAA